MQRSPTLALNTRALGRMAKFSQVRFNSSDTSSKPPTEEENPAPARKAIPRVSDLGGISLASSNPVNSAQGSNNWLSSLAVNNFGTGQVGNGGLAARLARQRAPVQSRATGSEAPTQSQAPTLSSQSRVTTTPNFGNGPSESTASPQSFGALHVPRDDIPFRAPPGGPRGRPQVRFDSLQELPAGQRGPRYDGQRLREPRDHNQQRGPREPRDYSQQQGPREPRDYNQQQGPREPREYNQQHSPREPRDYNQQQGPREPRDYSQQQGPREPRDYNQQKGPREPRDYNQQRSPREPRDYNQQQGPHVPVNQNQDGQAGSRVQVAPHMQNQQRGPRPPTGQPWNDPPRNGPPRNGPPRNGQPQGPRTPRQPGAQTGAANVVARRAGTPVRAPRPMQRRRAGDGAESEELPPSQVDALRHVPTTIKLGGMSVNALFAPRASIASGMRKVFVRRNRRRLQKPLAIVKGKLLTSRTKTFRQRSVGDYSRYRPAHFKVGSHLNAIKPSILAHIALSHNQAPSLRGRVKALAAIKQALAVGTDGDKVANV